MIEKLASKALVKGSDEELTPVQSEPSTTKSRNILKLKNNDNN